MKTISDRFLISIDRQPWYGIGLAHVFDLESKAERAIESVPINTKEELKDLKHKYYNCKVKYQS